MGLYRRLGLCVSLREEPPEHQVRKAALARALLAASGGTAALLSTTDYGDVPVSQLESPRHKGLG